MKIIKTCLSAMISGILIFSPAYADKWSDQFPHIKQQEIFLVIVLMKKFQKRTTKEKL